MKPLPPVSATACARAEDSGSSGRGNGTRSMTTSWQAGPGTSTPCQSERVPKSDVRRIPGEVADQGRGLVLALQQHWRLEPLAHQLGGGPRRAHRAEQPEGAAACRSDEGLELVELGGTDAVAARWREVLRDVQDRLLGVLEGAADVEPGPLGRVRAGQAERAGQRVEGAAELQGRRGQHDGALAEQLLAQQPGHRDRGDVQDLASALLVGQPDDVLVVTDEEPFADVEDLLHTGLSRPAGRRRSPRPARA